MTGSRSGRSWIVDRGLSEDAFYRRHEDGVEKAWEEEWRREYVTLEMRYQEKYEEGYAEGEQEVCVETAKKMLADGWDHKLIAKYSGLPIEETEELAQPQPE